MFCTYRLINKPFSVLQTQKTGCFLELDFYKKGQLHHIQCELWPLGCLRESFTVHAYPQCCFISRTCFAHKCQHEESVQSRALRLQGQKTWKEVRCQVCRSSGCGFGFSSETIRRGSRPLSCFLGWCCVLGFCFFNGIVCTNSVNAFDLVCMSFCAVKTQRHNIFWSRRVLVSWAIRTGDWQDAFWILQTGHFPTRFLLLSWQDATLLTGYFLDSPDRKVSPHRMFPGLSRGDAGFSERRLPPLSWQDSFLEFPKRKLPGFLTGYLSDCLSASSEAEPSRQ